MGEQQFSMMERADQQKIRDAQAQREQQQFDILKPVYEAKAVADVAQAHATISGLTRSQNLRTQAAAAFNQANQDFQDALQWTPPESTGNIPASDGTPEGDAAQQKAISDQSQQIWDGRAARLAQVHAQYSWMGAIPEYKPLVDSLSQAQLQFTHSSDLNRQIQLRDAIAKEQTAAAVERANIMAQGGVERANVAAAGGVEKAGVMAAGGVQREQVRSEGAMARTQVRSYGTANDAAIREFGAAANGLDKAAMESGDPAQAAALAAKANAYRQKIDQIRTTPAGPATPAAGGPSITVPTPAGGESVPSDMNVPAGESAAVPAAPTPAPTKPGKLYVINPTTQKAEFGPNVKTLKDAVAALQEMTDNNVITPEQARATMVNLGFKPKTQP